MKSQDFLDLAHGQPFLWQSGSSTVQWKPGCRWFAQRASARQLHKTIPPMPIAIPTVPQTDRLPLGMLIAITSES
jgi:hypothetical protein